MAVVKLEEVTSALTTLLRENILQTTTLPPVTVTPQAPDQVSAGGSSTLVLHLYHVTPNPHLRNLPGRDRTDARTTPLALTLFYILTVPGRANDDAAAYGQQTLFGHALRTLHEYPVVTQDTHVGPTLVLPKNLRTPDTHIEITMRTLTPEDAFAIWNTGSSQFTRLSAYYEVRAIIFEAAPAQQAPGRVLSLGAYLTDLTPLRLVQSRNRVLFDAPGPLGGTTVSQEIEVEPAMPSSLDSAAPSRAAATLDLRGTGLTSGAARRLILRNDRWSQLGDPAVPLDPTLALNADWSVDYADDVITLQLGPSLTFRTPTGLKTIPVLPGTYTAQLEVTLAGVNSGGGRPVVRTSNEMAFQICPRVLIPIVKLAADRFRIPLVPGFPLVPPATAGGPLDIAVSVDGEMLVDSTSPVGPLTPPGRFTLQPTMPAIDIKLPVALPAGNHRVDVTISGAPSQPAWIQV
ncbi:DUF4255 domain-containing protein [Bradyrhizobium japonicum]|uniref:DUF4255 domain-containing protein n=1 Tax=Bradyrhizobium japonicum TaxID=375 RepID=UPI000412F59B|nr:DUF4255 domain-containing protein [Bradyrhizobium japonicum]WLB91310.1 DUF4255 domain-containing protein [Bradyrhizobium japonicum USDA 135]